MQPLQFAISHTLAGTRARAGILRTPHGDIETPAFIPVGTKATVKGLTPEHIAALGAQAVLSNTYHLYLEPGADRVALHGGLHQFMQWQGPTFTDSGGFQVFSLGVALGKNITKFVQGTEEIIALLPEETETGVRLRGGAGNMKPAKVQEDGVRFSSHIDGSLHFFTPEHSIDIQHKLGADIIFAFDECTSPTESDHYQQRSLDRTHRWAEQCLIHHHSVQNSGRMGVSEPPAALQGLYGVVQGARSERLRRESAQKIASLRVQNAAGEQVGFDGFGIGGSYDKEDLHSAVQWVCEELPEDKPRHLLGIGEPEDLFEGVLAGVDTFDCVAPTRIARTGSAYTHAGKINLKNAMYRDDMNKLDAECSCMVCSKYTRSYLAHLFRSDEMLGAVLVSYHNLYFIVNLVKRIRAALIEGNLVEFKDAFLTTYKAK